MFQTVLSNKDHMEYGMVTVPFPIPEDQYADITRMLEVLHVGSELSRDCMVESVEGDWPVLNVLAGREVNLDELDYLAKHLDGFSPYEKVQFQAAAERYGLTQVTDLINLTFCCDQATVIVDFSDLEQVGRIHYLTLNGGATREEMESLDGYETALLLINEHPGIITPYGVFYDNGMQLEPVYDGRYFPQYLYADSVLTLALASDEDLKKGANVTWLYLPCSEERLERALTRAEITQRSDINLFVMDNNLPCEVSRSLNLEDELPQKLNQLAQEVGKLDKVSQAKLGAVTAWAQPAAVEEVVQLCRNLDQFDFIPHIHSVQEYGKYMVQESGDYYYDAGLEGYIDYERLGQSLLFKEIGQFVESGYISYKGTLTLEELMMGDSVEQYRAEQGPLMGGM
ncbi:MAG: antirestriction protein ArdA [Oscillospiraceae bacterium]|nr:antirestriction protein ArdA [Oscillospiraceae bacterium]